MTASERQRKRAKYDAKTGLKQYRERKKRTSPALESPPPAPENPETEIAAQRGGPSGADPEDDDGGPVDKSVLISFKDHIAYAIWNREEVLFTLQMLYNY